MLRLRDTKVVMAELSTDPNTDPTTDQKFGQFDKFPPRFENKKLIKLYPSILRKIIFYTLFWTDLKSMGSKNFISDNSRKAVDPS